MITQQDINQFKDIIEAIEEDTLESVRFVKAFELCNVVFQTAKFDLVKLSQNKDFALDTSIELDGITESLNGLLSPLLNQIDVSLEEFKSSAKANNENLERLNKEYTEKYKRLENLQKIKIEYENLENELLTINPEIEKYEKIDIEKVQNELNIKIENLNKLKEEKEPLLQMWKKHLEENRYIDIKSDEMQKLSKEIEMNLKDFDGLIRKTFGELNE